MTEQDKARQNKTEQDKTEQDKTEHMTEQDKIEQDRTEQSRGKRIEWVEEEDQVREQIIEEFKSVKEWKRRKDVNRRIKFKTEKRKYTNK